MKRDFPLFKTLLFLSALFLFRSRFFCRHPGFTSDHFSAVGRRPLTSWQSVGAGLSLANADLPPVNKWPCYALVKLLCARERKQKFWRAEPPSKLCRELRRKLCR